MKKILLLTASYGTGHISATNSINEVIKQRHPDWQVKIIDYLAFRKVLPQNKLTFFQKLYNFSMEKPVLFDVFFFVTNNRFCTTILEFIINFSSYKLMEELLDEYRPDIVISTHPYWNFLIKKYKKKHENLPKYICVITDSYMVHKSWISYCVDYYCVIDEDTKHILINNGIRSIHVTGFPVHPKLFQMIDRKKILAELGLQEGKLTILITVGLGVIERFMDIIDYLRTKTEDFQMIIVTGKYKQVYDLLMTKEFTPKTKIIGWTDRMHDFIRVSDLVICKAGGAIVSESLSAGVPVLVPVYTPAQERGNAYIITKYKLGYCNDDINLVFKFLDDIISGKLKLSTLKENIVRYINPNPAEKIIHLVEKIFEGRI